MKNIFKYKDFSGSIEFSLEDKCLFGKILFVSDLVTYEAETIPQLQAEFEAAVDDYLDTCKELGVSPDKPFKGSFNVRIGQELHQGAAKAAYREGIKLNDFIKRAVEERLDRVGKEVVIQHCLHTIEYTSAFPTPSNNCMREVKINGSILYNGSNSENGPALSH